MEALQINDTTYAGTVASYMITRAVVGADTIDKGCVYVKDGIKKKYTIPRVEVAKFIQRRKATPTSQGEITIDGQVLAPRDLMLYTEFNPRDFEEHWYAEQLSPTLLARELPATAESFIVMQQMKRLNEWFESSIWRSRIEYDTEGAQVDPVSKGADASDAEFFYFDGLLKRMLDAGSNPVETRIKLVATPKILVSGTAQAGEENVVDALKRVYDLVPKALLFKYGPGGLKFLVSYHTQQLYEESLATMLYKNQDTTEKGINRYKGYNVEPLAGLPDNTIVCCIAKPDVDSNTWVGMNSLDDNQLQLSRLQANSELFFLKGLFKLDTNVGFPDQIVLYTTITA